MKKTSCIKLYYLLPKLFVTFVPVIVNELIESASLSIRRISIIGMYLE